MDERKRHEMWSLRHIGFSDLRDDSRPWFVESRNIKGEEDRIRIYNYLQIITKYSI